MAGTESRESPVRLEQADRTLVIRLNRPEALNAFNDDMLLHLGLAFREAASDDQVDAVVLTGTGRGFCAGADVKVGWDETSAKLGIRRRLNPVILALAAIEKPVIAAINGVAAGAGLGFAGACDTRLCSTGARFVPATVKLGIVPDGGMTYFVPRLIGPGRAFTWLCGGAHLDAETALAWGLVDEVVEAADLFPRALRLAELFGQAPGASVPLTKRLLRQAPGQSLADQLEREQQCQDEAFLHRYHRAPSEGGPRPFRQVKGAKT